MVRSFGDFRFDNERRLLTLNGRRVKLVGQPLDLLVLLLDRPGALVTREEIRGALWPDSHVDFEHSLDVVVSRVRSVLGDNGSSARYVETVPRKGYRFVEPVTVCDLVRPEPLRTWHRRAFAYVAVAILAALVAILFARTRYDPIVRSQGSRPPSQQAG